MINRIITNATRKQFDRALKFDEGTVPDLPPCDDAVPRLLYIHIPFCEELCPYCSFHRVRLNEDLVIKYHAALRLEMALYRQRGYRFTGLYAGGGTPTVLIDELAETLRLARALFPIGSVSVETNPDHLTDANIKILKQAGVNRLSVGVQTFDDGLLRQIARYDKYGSGEEIAARLEQVSGKFDTLNADMIFNFPGQTAAMLEADLAMLQRIKMQQITFYPLMVSSLTQSLMRETMGEVNFRREKSFFKLILRRLEEDYDSSSAWCFSRKKTGSSLIDEYVVDFDEYAGLGSGAIGYLNGVCYANTFDIGGYISGLEQGRLPLEAARAFNFTDRMRYDFLMKLFSTHLNVNELEEKYEGRFLKTLWKEMAAFTLAGAFRYFSPNLFLTPWGRYYWVIMMREFFIAVNNFRDYCRRQAGQVQLP
ncbi:MAG TPA: coproporphyrinogen III oxidase family protein [Smithellaceae bacterium]|nr:coproporphyrinogen III oxidase family protein [Smithellaceae bacterium]HQF83533.1 coproporphyrinogen III oxidase family protein [Smithellaceae bacterium]HQG79722.1 coproporphyrinogen III oxidase family protein [Smithellaceae bacterium]